MSIPVSAKRPSVYKEQVSRGGIADSLKHEVSEAALRCAASEFLKGDTSVRQSACEFLQRNPGGLTMLPFDVLRALVSSDTPAGAVFELLHAIQNHPVAMRNVTPVLVDRMRHADEHLAMVVARGVQVITEPRDAVALPVALLRESRRQRHQRVAHVYEASLRGDQIFDVEVYRSCLQQLRGLSLEQQARLVVSERSGAWYSSERGQAIVLGALSHETQYIRRLGLETLRATDYQEICDAARLLIETALAFNARALVSEYSPRLIRNLFVQVAAQLEYSPALASVLFEVANAETKRAMTGEISAEIPMKLFYGAASLLRGADAEEAMAGLGQFLTTRNSTVLSAVAKRFVQLSAQLPEATGELAVRKVFEALRERVDRDASPEEITIVVKALADVSGYDQLIVEGCSALVARSSGADATAVVRGVLRDRLGRMLESDTIQKALSMLQYLGESFRDGSPVASVRRGPK